MFCMYPNLQATCRLMSLLVNWLPEKDLVQGATQSGTNVTSERHAMHIQRGNADMTVPHCTVMLANVQPGSLTC